MKTKNDAYDAEIELESDWGDDFDDSEDEQNQRKSGKKN